MYYAAISNPLTKNVYHQNKVIHGSQSSYNTSGLYLYEYMLICAGHPGDPLVPPCGWAHVVMAVPWDLYAYTVWDPLHRLHRAGHA
jgi:hypothetical protein